MQSNNQVGGDGDRAPYRALEALKSSGKPIALFLTYQRTTFTDAFRTVLGLKEDGEYEPVFLIAAGTSHLLEREVELCAAHSIGIFREEDILQALEPPKEKAPVPPVVEPEPVAPEEPPSVPAADNVVVPAAGNAVAEVPDAIEEEPTFAERFRDGIENVGARLARRLVRGLSRFGSPVLDTDNTLVRVDDVVTITWATANPRAAACEIFLTDDFRKNYLVWNGLSGSAQLQVLSDSILTLRCVDSGGVELPTAKPLAIKVKKLRVRPRPSTVEKPAADVQTVQVQEPELPLAEDEEYEPEPRGLGYRRVLRREPWFGWFQQIIKADLRYQKIIRALRPAVVCLSEDILGPLSGPLIRAARRCGVPSVIVPFTIPNPIEILEYCTKNPESVVEFPKHQELLERYPHFAQKYQGRILLRSNPELLMASEFSGIGSRTPFVSNSGQADRILVESQRMHDVYRKLDFPAHQLVVTGSVTDDRLAAGLQRKQILRNALYERLGLPPDRPMLLSALVPDQLISGVPSCEFTVYADLIDFWAQTIAACGSKYNVVLKINPRERREDFLHLERHGLVIASDDTVDLVPLADIYVASLSSTLRWAAACSIPCINYDVYRFRYGDYVGTPGIVHVEEKDEFAATMQRLANDDAYWAELRALQAADAPSWGRLDGRTTERIKTLFSELRSEISMSRPSIQRSLKQEARAVGR